MLAISAFAYISDVSSISPVFSLSCILMTMKYSLIFSVYFQVLKFLYNYSECTVVISICFILFSNLSDVTQQDKKRHLQKYETR
ncbi:hypothetical protein BZA70DRAFT_284281, partial [Myxozyma melibiosi]